MSVLYKTKVCVGTCTKTIYVKRQHNNGENKGLSKEYEFFYQNMNLKKNSLTDVCTMHYNT